MVMKINVEPVNLFRCKQQDNNILRHFVAWQVINSVGSQLTLKTPLIDSQNATTFSQSRYYSHFVKDLGFLTFSVVSE